METWNYYSEVYLRHLGISNQNTTLEDSIRESKQGKEAQCTSFHCCGDRHSSNGVKKNVDKSTLKCPDCGHYLIWRKRV